MKTVLSEADYEHAALTLGCEVAAIRAVADVEAGGAGFKDDRPKILFEGHIFYRYTNGRFAVDHPDLCYKTWTKKFYAKTQAGEWLRFNAASSLDAKAAVLATSWGKFQIMGFNHMKAGYLTPALFVAGMSDGEPEQLKAFVAFLQNTGLDKPLAAKDWAAFAKGFNGQQYKLNRYDEKLAEAYRIHGGV